MTASDVAFYDISIIIKVGMCFHEDVNAGIIFIVEKRGKFFVIGGPYVIEMMQIVSSVLNILGNNEETILICLMCCDVKNIVGTWIIGYTASS